jgi:hypothetical protein
VVARPWYRALRGGRSGSLLFRHETLTRFWVRIVAHASRATLAETLEAHPMLLRKDLLLQHWSRETLYGDAAREAWIEPDIQPLPFP